MALTFTLITPAVSVGGGGILVLFTGTGFDADTQKMRVKFGGVESRRVRVRDGLTGPPATNDGGTLMDAIVPQNPLAGPGTVLVEVFNDATSESVSTANAFEYKRPDLAIRSHLSLVYRQLLLQLRRDVLEETVMLAALDWSRPTERKRAVAKVPAIVLEGPRILDNKEEGDFDPAVTIDNSVFEWDQQRETQRVNLEFDISIVTRGAGGGIEQAQAIIRYVMDFFRRTPYLLVPEGEVGAQVANIMTYPMSLPEDFRSVESEEPDIYRFLGVCVVEAVGIQVADVVDFGKTFTVQSSPTVDANKTVP